MLTLQHLHTASRGQKEEEGKKKLKETKNIKYPWEKVEIELRTVRGYFSAWRNESIQRTETVNADTANTQIHWHTDTQARTQYMKLTRTIECIVCGNLVSIRNTLVFLWKAPVRLQQARLFFKWELIQAFLRQGHILPLPK